LIDLLANLKARHVLDIHAIIPPPAVRDRVERRGLSIRGYGNRSRTARLADLLGHLSRRPSYDLVWSLWIDRTGWAGVLASRILRRPLVLSVMAAELADIPPIQYGYARSHRARLGLRAMSRAARRITVGSHLLQARFGDVCPGSLARVRCLPLGIPALERRPERRGARLVAVTTLQPVKQANKLLRVVADLAKSRDATLDLYGYATPAELDRFRTEARRLQVEDRIHHFGFIEPDALRARYREYDLLLHASAYESQGMALIEAAAADVPIACFDVGVARELLELGAAVSIASDDDLSHAAARALDRSPAHAAERIISRYSIDRTTADFEALLAEAAR
jgi:glycosyltransferase involved in cell wall biosynthesis